VIVGIVFLIAGVVMKKKAAPAPASMNPPAA
jgi:hypothetical protein